ncbi:MAG: TetR/AcrR family transcriptional regulator [Bacteroidales bacterium]|nr:TetR/AcrR family transcriptional regulator [Bacteroidales bacterium]
MKDTRSEIISIANEMVRSVGYNAFSYADISGKLNIKNAAIHYYFPTKGDLGVEIIKVNLTAFNEKVNSWRNLSIRTQLKRYITMHDSFVKNHWICIVGSLSSSYDTLPEKMQEELQKLVNTIINWLTELLSKGKESGELIFNDTPRARAYVIHSSMLSALLMNKVLRNDVYKSVQTSLLNI